VANAILDGTSAVMLSGETSVGPHPVQAVRWMAKIAIAAEQNLEPSSKPSFELAEDSGEAVMCAAVQLATQRGAAALIVPTTTGGSARACAKYRPGVPIVALAHDAGTAQQLALEWGVIPSTIPAPETVDDLITAAIEHGAEVAALESGSPVVLTAGNIGEQGTTNLIVLRDVPARVARDVTTPGVVTSAAAAAALTS
jgi:pyruvate kinase